MTKAELQARLDAELASNLDLVARIQQLTTALWDLQDRTVKKTIPRLKGAATLLEKAATHGTEASVRKQCLDLSRAIRKELGL